MVETNNIVIAAPLNLADMSGLVYLLSWRKAQGSF